MLKLQKMLYITASGALLASLTGCSTLGLSSNKETKCVQEAIAPAWVCKPYAKDGYAGLGVAEKIEANLPQMKKIALKNARLTLAQEMQSQVKNKLLNFSRTTGLNESEAIGALYISISKQITKKELTLADQVKTWTAPSGKLYWLVVAPKSSFDEELKSAVKKSYAQDKIAWQPFQSEIALENLEKEFGIKTLNEQSNELPASFAVEVVKDMRVVVK